MTRKAPAKRVTLSKGRPPASTKPQASLSKRATQYLIRSHHELNKQLAKAKARGYEHEITSLQKHISNLGGLKSYQLASIQGQSNERGGDSSTVLLEWLEDLKPVLAAGQKLRMLEVGALSTKNACTRSGMFDIQRIDLNSQSEGIVQQDFMKRPLPQYYTDRFDIISLSLVLNFVPSEPGRGDMLKRTCQFLNQRAPRTMSESLQGKFPALFLVLPAACISNSRYMNEERLTLMMASLGYVCLKRKQTAKLIYYLWQLRDRLSPDEQKFPKREVNPGGQRNNFCVVLQK
ncbi:25S rRNA (adenine2142-N1)-methyltransferase [Vermiconidia calcicola]|uniref:25S rRNA (Adenine2142-N1)-methyltransferase n=1 Tax=Vermiconidia calcicola TaxID=1690605 RepID=A0ACC3NK29_9PEZI|nr:25S rRNA (adenine2142-N1)-methyltransferase [Vermiconidia calcicola]